MYSLDLLFFIGDIDKQIIFVDLWPVKVKSKEQLIIILNLTPVPRPNYRIGVPLSGIWEEVLNSDNTAFYGSGRVNSSAIITDEISWQGKAYSICLTIPPLAAVVLKVK